MKAAANGADLIALAAEANAEHEAAARAAPRECGGG
jgi:hypothetical protein